MKAFNCPISSSTSSLCKTFSVFFEGVVYAGVLQRGLGVEHLV